VDTAGGELDRPRLFAVPPTRRCVAGRGRGRRFRRFITRRAEGEFPLGRAAVAVERRARTTRGMPSGHLCSGPWGTGARSAGRVSQVVAQPFPGWTARHRCSHGMGAPDVQKFVRRSRVKRARYLGHIRAAWDHALFRAFRLAEAGCRPHRPGRRSTRFARASLTVQAGAAGGAGAGSCSSRSRRRRSTRGSTRRGADWGPARAAGAEDPRLRRRAGGTSDFTLIRVRPRLAAAAARCSSTGSRSASNLILGGDNLRPRRWPITSSGASRRRPAAGCRRTSGGRWCAPAGRPRRRCSAREAAGAVQRSRSPAGGSRLIGRVGPVSSWRARRVEQGARRGVPCRALLLDARTCCAPFGVPGVRFAVCAGCGHHAIPGGVPHPRIEMTKPSLARGQFGDPRPGQTSCCSTAACFEVSGAAGGNCWRCWKGWFGTTHAKRRSAHSLARLLREEGGGRLPIADFQFADRGRTPPTAAPQSAIGNWKSANPKEPSTLTPLPEYRERGSKQRRPSGPTRLASPRPAQTTGSTSPVARGAALLRHGPSRQGRPPFSGRPRPLVLRVGVQDRRVPRRTTGTA